MSPADDKAKEPAEAPARRASGKANVPDRQPTAVAQQDALVYVQRLTKLYPVRRGLFRRPELLYALNGVSFYVRRRETFGLVGESGSGKTTLGRTLLRLIEPTFGRVIVDGREITSLPPSELRLMRQRMQIVFQDPYSSLNPSMTVGEIVREGIDIFGLARSRAQADERVAALLGRVGLAADMRRRYPYELSGGQRQRIAIARALAVEPDFIVLDEPLSALDLSVQAQIINLLDELQQQMGLSLLFISHDLRAVQYLSHRIAVMVRGKMVEMGPTESVVRHQHHPYTRALFGVLPSTFWSGHSSAAAESSRRPELPELRPESAEDPEEPVPSSRGQHGARPDRAALAATDARSASALEPPKGCVYFARCPRAEPGSCDMQTPDLVELSPRSHHRVACFHPNTDPLGSAD